MLRDELQETVDAFHVEGSDERNTLDENQKALLAAPGDHLQTLSYVSAQMSEGPEAQPIRYQRLFSHAKDRLRLEKLRSQMSIAHRCRITGLLHPMTRAWLRALPARDSYIVADAEYVWNICTRLGLEQPSCIGLPKECTCKAGKGLSIDQLGWHTRWCPKGGGPLKVHNVVRDTVHAMCVNAGVVAETETEGLLPNGEQRPGDVVIHKPTAKDETWAVDVTIVNYLPTTRWMSERTRRKLMDRPGFAARAAEQRKRDKKHNGDRMEDRLRARGMQFHPMGFDALGTPGKTWSNLLKKLSSTAHVRRKHDPKTFRDRWTTCISMAIAKHGARVAIARAAAITYETPAQHTRWRTGNEPLPPRHAAAIECVQEGGARGC